MSLVSHSDHGKLLLRSSIREHWRPMPKCSHLNIGVFVRCIGDSKLQCSSLLSFCGYVSSDLIAYHVFLIFLQVPRWISDHMCTQASTNGRAHAHMPHKHKRAHTRTHR